MARVEEATMRRIVITSDNDRVRAVSRMVMDLAIAVAPANELAMIEAVTGVGLALANVIAAAPPRLREGLLEAVIGMVRAQYADAKATVDVTFWSRKAEG